MLYGAKPSCISTIIQTLLTFIVLAPCRISGRECSAVTTFNSGLLPRIENYWYRREAIPEALLEEVSDVICLQEYWFERDVDLLVETVSKKYPYHYSKLHVDVSHKPPAENRTIPRAPCSETDVIHFTLKVLPCGLRECLPELSESLETGMMCIIQKCTTHLMQEYFNPDCISCVILTAVSFDSLLVDACTPNLFTYDNQLNSAGLVLLSKKPFNATYREYFPGKRLSRPRGYIEAEIEDLGTVVCTHLSAIYDRYFEYDLPLENYTAQQRDEIRVLGKEFGSRDHLLMGDLNTGPEVTGQADPERNLVGEYRANYELILRQGYRSSYLDDDGRCSFCNNNSLVVDYPNVLVDYVMLHGRSYSSYCVKRTLDAYDPMLSDHYGVRTTVCRD